MRKKNARVPLPEAAAVVWASGFAACRREGQLRGGKADDRTQPISVALAHGADGRPPGARGRTGRTPGHRPAAAAPRRRPERHERAPPDARAPMRVVRQTPIDRDSGRPRGRPDRRGQFQQHAPGSGHADKRKVSTTDLNK